MYCMLYNPRGEFARKFSFKKHPQFSRGREVSKLRLQLGALRAQQLGMVRALGGLTGNADFWIPQKGGSLI